jgi:UDP-glucuronate decarboxylase
MPSSPTFSPIPRRLLDEDAARALNGLDCASIRGQRVLLTGASGLIGSHFLAGMLQLRKVLGAELELHAAVRHGLPEWFADDLAQRRFTLHQGDLCDPHVVASLPPANVVIHAATYGQPALFTRDPTSTIRLNTTGTIALLDKVQPGGLFLFVSTSEVYSGLAGPPFSEEQIGATNTTHPRACYIEAKRCGEAICFNYHRDGVTAKAVRLSLAYGPGTRAGDGRVLNMFIEKALRQGEIRLLDDGSAKRTYCYVSDAMFMMWRVLLRGRAALYNVGGACHTTIAALANRIGEMLAVPVIIPNHSATGLPGAPAEVWLNCSRFDNEFGSHGTVPLEEGLSRTIEWQTFLYGKTHTDLTARVSL